MGLELISQIQSPNVPAKPGASSPLCLIYQTPPGSSLSVCTLLSDLVDQTCLPASTFLPIHLGFLPSITLSCSLDPQTRLFLIARFLK